MPRCFLSLLMSSSFLSQSLSGGLVVYNRVRGRGTSGLLFLFWCFLALCGAVQYYYELTNENGEQVRVYSKCQLPFIMDTLFLFY
jgi:hypothetical protein